ncbi:MAG: hypothetical protein HKO58_02855 [Gammaproteobacteria bacterium]|nr:hypothetical protein [Gammaproteobacteria bacterium]
MQAAIEFANQLKERSPDAVMYGKRLFNETWLSSDGVRLKKETEFQENLIGSWNQLAASGGNMLKTKLPFKTRK